MTRLLLAVLGLALLAVAPARADERILRYDVDIAIQADASLEVVETITVRAEGRNIRRGIYRDFPTRYRDRAGNNVVVELQVLGVERNGQTEPWFTERVANGVRINTGNDDFLPVPAEHTYTLRYRTTRQLGFFEAHDELYFNAIGHGWIAAEGIVGVFVTDDRAQGGLIEVNCETDFVAKNDDFLNFVATLARLVVEKRPADVAALSALPLDGAKTVDQVRTELVGRIGENLSIRRFVRQESADAGLTSYIHGGSKIGVLIDVAGADEGFARDLAMHIAAIKPVALSRAEVSAELIEKERSIAQQKAAESGKPAEIVAKMVEGSVQKFLKEVALLDQPFVKAEDGKTTVDQLLKQKKATVKRFDLFVVGEGIEKRQDDFAAEVAAQVAAAR